MCFGKGERPDLLACVALGRPKLLRRHMAHESFLHVGRQEMSRRAALYHFPAGVLCEPRRTARSRSISCFHFSLFPSLFFFRPLFSHSLSGQMNLCCALCEGQFSYSNPTERHGSFSIRLCSVLCISQQVLLLNIGFVGQIGPTVCLFFPTRK